MSQKVMVIRLSLLFIVSLVSTLLLQCMAAEASARAFKGYSFAPKVPATQSQVIYYRLGEFSEVGAGAHVYIGGAFHTVLLPGSYIVFCLSAGTYNVKTLLSGATGLAESKSTRVRLDEGFTQFIRLDATGDEGSSIVSRIQAEREIGDTLYQVHVLSRAPGVQACVDQVLL